MILMARIRMNLSVKKYQTSFREQKIQIINIIGPMNRKNIYAIFKK